MATTGMGRSTRGIWAKRLAAAVAIAALGLTACSKDEEPEKSAVELAVERNAEYYKNLASDSGGDDSASDGGEAGGFTMPPENEGILPPDRANYPGIDSETDEGAQQTVKFFFDAMYYGYATGDTDPMETIARTDCRSCSELVDDIRERTKVQGGFITGYSIEPQTLTVAPQNRPGFTTVYYAYSESEIAKKFSDGSETVYPGKNMHAAAYLKKSDGRWEIGDLSWEEDVDA